jgi:hypothetical protein
MVDFLVGRWRLAQKLSSGDFAEGQVGIVGRAGNGFATGTRPSSVSTMGQGEPRVA